MQSCSNSYFFYNKEDFFILKMQRQASAVFVDGMEQVYFWFTKTGRVGDVVGDDGGL